MNEDQKPPKQRRQKFALYTNPNNVTNNAYSVEGASEVNTMLRNARQYPDSYTVLMQGFGTDSDIQSAKDAFRHYKFV